jgi:hypothetical protein
MLNHKHDMDIQQIADNISLNRSRYQMERFVIGQHHRPEMQYRQLVVEAVGLTETLKETELRILKIEAECEELRATGKRSDEIEAQIKENSIAGLRRHMTGSQRELDHLQELIQRYPQYTLEDIEAAQEEYWNTRLMRTAHFQALSGGVGWAQIEAIWQAGLLPELTGKILEEEIAKIKSPELPEAFND